MLPVVQLQCRDCVLEGCNDMVCVARAHIMHARLHEQMRHVQYCCHE